jgi:hypothetical protein
MTTYYRTAGGTRRHKRDTCALVRKRNLRIGEVSRIPARDVAAFPPCSVCCPDEAKTSTAAPKRKAPAAPSSSRCPNPGVEKPQRMMSKCKACGKEGTVIRGTGALRAHDRPK